MTAANPLAPYGRAVLDAWARGEDKPAERLPAPAAPARARAPGALEIWRRERAAGIRSPLTFDLLWRAACREAEANDLEAAGCPAGALAARRDALGIMGALAGVTSVTDNSGGVGRGKGRAPSRESAPFAGLRPARAAWEFGR